MELRQDWRAFEKVFGMLKRSDGPTMAPIGALKLDAAFRSEVDLWMVEALKRPHYLDQVIDLKKRFSQSRIHFFLDVLLPVWKLVMPATCGVFIHVEGERTRSLLMVFHGGHIEGYWEPDLNQLDARKTAEREQVIKFLSGKYLVPVQGVFFSESEWDRLSASQQALMDFVRAVRADAVQLVPKRWSLLAFSAAASMVKR